MANNKLHLVQAKEVIDKSGEKTREFEPAEGATMGNYILKINPSMKTGARGAYAQVDCLNVLSGKDAPETERAMIAESGKNADGKNIAAYVLSYAEQNKPINMKTGGEIFISQSTMRHISDVVGPENHFIDGKGRDFIRLKAFAFADGGRGNGGPYLTGEIAAPSKLDNPPKNYAEAAARQADGIDVAKNEVAAFAKANPDAVAKYYPEARMEQKAARAAAKEVAEPTIAAVEEPAKEDVSKEL